MDLNVTMGEAGAYRVTGGLEPHVVRVKAGKTICDCVDFGKGHVCKHVLAVRLFMHDEEVKQLARKLMQARHDQNLDDVFARLGKET